MRFRVGDVVTAEEGEQGVVTHAGQDQVLVRWGADERVVMEDVIDLRFAWAEPLRETQSRVERCAKAAGAERDVWGVTSWLGTDAIEMLTPIERACMAEGRRLAYAHAASLIAQASTSVRPR